MIFKNLDRVTSTCLGLACTALYQIHWQLRGKVPLTVYCAFERSGINLPVSRRLLARRLRSWIPEDLVVVEGRWGMFMTKERRKETQEEIK